MQLGIFANVDDDDDGDDEDALSHYIHCGVVLCCHAMSRTDFPTPSSSSSPFAVLLSVLSKTTAYPSFASENTHTPDRQADRQTDRQVALNKTSRICGRLRDARREAHPLPPVRRVPRRELEHRVYLTQEAMQPASMLMTKRFRSTWQSIDSRIMKHIRASARRNGLVVQDTSLPRHRPGHRASRYRQSVLETAPWIPWQYRWSLKSTLLSRIVIWSV